MRYIAGIDIGNSSTEVALARQDEAGGGLALALHGVGRQAGSVGSAGVSKRAGAAGAVAGCSAVLMAVARREGLRLMLSSFHAYL